VDGKPDDELRVDVWTYRISGVERCEGLLELLSGPERERYRRFHFPKHRREFLCAHALLRLALSRYAGGNPGKWEFARGQWGKPYVTGAEQLHFNLSHTEGLVACAITGGCEVGVDVERVDRAVDASNIARRFFADEESQYIESLAGDRQRDAFFRIWTLKEAYVKASGRGFDLPLREFWFELSNGQIRVTPAGDWKFWESEPADGYRMAVAALGKATGLELRSLDGAELL
jgi:4'-phosphopantetheinyl transferase